MEVIQQARLESLERIQTYMDQNQDLLEAVNKSRTRQALDALVPVLAAHAADQHGAMVEAQSKTEIKERLRQDLRVHHMQQIAAIAKAKLSTLPEDVRTPLMAKLRYPAIRSTDKALVAAGQSMAEAVGQYTQVFLDEGLPPDFVEQLTAATDAVRKATADRDVSQVRVREATVGLTTQFERARSQVHVLNALVVKALKGHPDKLEGWKSAKRVRQKGGAVAPKQNVAPTVPTTTVAPPSAPLGQTLVSTTQPVVVPAQQMKEAA